MALFDYKEDESLGNVTAVDTASVTILVDNVELLRKMQVNRLVALRSSKAGQHLIGMVQKIIRNEIEQKEETQTNTANEKNIVKITLIGTFFDKLLTKDNIFRRTLETVPEIDAACFSIEGKRLTEFMKAISYQSGSQDQSLSLGNYTIDDDAIAYLDANRFFQRHAVVVGSTGSGKSWTTARLLEQIAELSNCNAILFDVHGEYNPINGDGIRHYHIAGPNDVINNKGINEGVLYFPYWLLGYEDMTTIVIICKDTEERIILSLLNQIGWKSRIQSIVTESELIKWYEVGLRGQYSDLTGEKILSYLKNEIQSEFPSTNNIEFERFLKERNYHELNDDFWE